MKNEELLKELGHDIVALRNVVAELPPGISDDDRENLKVQVGRLADIAELVEEIPTP